MKQPPFIPVRQGLEPYSLEAMRADDLCSWSSSSTGSRRFSDDHTTSDSDADDVYDGPVPMLGIVDFDMDNRVGNTHWCSCGHCRVKRLSFASEHVVRNIPLFLVSLRNLVSLFFSLVKESFNCKMHMPGTVKCRPTVA